MPKAISRFLRFAERLVASEEGVVAIEFGIVASVLILMTVGATDLGLAARHRGQMESAVRAGIQKAMAGGTEDAVKTTVLAATDLPSSPTPTAEAVKKCYDDSGTSQDCASAAAKSTYMEIKLTQNHQWLLGRPGFPSPLPITFTRTVRIK